MTDKLKELEFNLNKELETSKNLSGKANLLEVQITDHQKVMSDLEINKEELLKNVESLTQKLSAKDAEMSKVKSQLKELREKVR